MPDFPSRGASATDVWTYATRALNSDVSNAVRDAILTDATLVSGADIAATNSRIGDVPAFEAAVETDIVMDGTEKILVEKTDAKIGLLDGYVDFTTMAGGDIIVIRQYMQIKAAGTYVKYAEETFSGAQTIPLLAVTTKTAKTKIKVTAEQTGGVNRTLPVQFYRKVQA